MTGFLVRQFIQTVEIADRRAHAEIIVRENIHPPKREDQKHLRGPNADTFYLNEILDDLFISQSSHPVQLQFACLYPVCKIEQVSSFLRRDSNAPQLIPFYP